MPCGLVDCLVLYLCGVFWISRDSFISTKPSFDLVMGVPFSEGANIFLAGIASKPNLGLLLCLVPGVKWSRREASYSFLSNT
jgi:hypothetical protein